MDWRDSLDGTFDEVFRYYLFRLYWETGKREKAYIYGKEILREQFKKKEVLLWK